MAISAIATAGPQPPTLASLLQVNRINPITGKDADDIGGASEALTPKTNAKAAITPKLVQDVLKTLNQLGAKTEVSTASAGQSQDVKKSALDFISSVVAAIKPETSSPLAKSLSPLQQLQDGIGQMVNQAQSGATLNQGVVQSAEQLLKSVGVPSNANTLGSLLEGLQKSILDESGAGGLINVTA